jgi:plasmid stabilization system protein ParE
MSLQIKWTYIASQSLSEVLEYTFEKFGTRQLRKLENRINTSVRRITFFPRLGKYEKAISESMGLEYHSVLVIKEIKIYYSISVDTIYIEYVKNTRMDDNTMLERINTSIR